MDLIIRNAALWQNKQLRRADLGIAGGTIVAIEASCMSAATCGLCLCNPGYRYARPGYGTALDRC
ncbi:MAG: hypothetical protein WA702_21905 [Bradyrhizobium sp.]|jgi:hypothetical protein|uniref:hypothetical protein n=1 Tax=Bradyrhizobium sp. TaxID=376 RepID=UPI003C79CFEA